jgi:hypothetical protein
MNNEEKPEAEPNAMGGGSGAALRPASAPLDLSPASSSDPAEPELSAEEIEALRKLEAEATPEPWEWDVDGIAYISPDICIMGNPAYPTPGPNAANAELIVAARNALPRLLSALAAMERERDAMRLVLTHGEALAIEREGKLRAEMAARERRIAEIEPALATAHALILMSRGYDGHEEEEESIRAALKPPEWLRAALAAEEKT